MDRAFIRKFWQTHVDNANDPRSVRILGQHYRIGDENAPAYPGSRGFGGSKFVIRFHDGRVVTTTNLWGQGEIDAEFRDALPDNATWDPVVKVAQPDGSVKLMPLSEANRGTRCACGTEGQGHQCDRCVAEAEAANERRLGR